MNKLFGLGTIALLAWGMTSCNNDLNVAGGPASGANNPVIAPDVIAWSGNQTFNPGINGAPSTGTRASNNNGNMWYQDWDCPTNVWEPTHGSSEDALTLEDLEAIKKLLSPGKETSNEIILPWPNYWVQQVYKGEDKYHPLDKCEPIHELDETVTGSDHMNKLIAYNPHTETIYGDPANNYQPYEGIVDYEHVNNFNSGNNTTEYTEDWNGTHPYANYYGTTLMTGMPTSGIDPNKQFGFHETWGTNHDYNNYLIVEYKGYYYVGFDYEAHKYDQNTQNHNEGYNIERDWNFTDWIVRISPAYPKGTNSDNPGGVTPSNPDQPVDNCPSCGDPLADHNENGVCSECDENGACRPCPDCPDHLESQCQKEGGCGDTCGCDNCKSDPTNPDPEKPGTNPNPGPNTSTDGKLVCDWCGHDIMWDTKSGRYVHMNGDVICGECDEHDTEHVCKHPEYTPSNDPSNPNMKYRYNEVEINLSVNDIHKDHIGNQKYDIADLVTKLSIHVRYPHDVEVIIPVPEKFYCDQDDLYILQDHYYQEDGTPNFEYDGQHNSVVYEFESSEGDKFKVELHVEFVKKGEDDLTKERNGYIRVWTKGIDHDLIRYLRNTYGDGINFEIYNYYNRGTKYTTGSYAQLNSIEELQKYLDNSIVIFDHCNDNMEKRCMPWFYINAFNNDRDKENLGEVNESDCYVWISGDERAEGWNEGVNPNHYQWFHPNAYQGTHLNGSPFNWIWTAQKVKGSVNPTGDNAMIGNPKEDRPYNNKQQD